MLVAGRIEVLVGVVDQASALHRVATGEDASVDALVGVTQHALVRKGNADLRIAGKAELSRGIDGEVLRPLNARETDVQ